MMQHKRTAFVALITFATGLLVGLAAGVGRSGSMTKDKVAHETAIAYAQVLQQHTARLGEVERSFQQRTARLADIEQALAAAMDGLQNAPPSEAKTDGHMVAALPAETVLRQDLHRLLREELRDVLAAVGTGEERGQEEQAEAEEEQQSQENREAFDTAYDIVGNALAIGRWTNDDGHSFRHALTSLTGKQQQEILELLIPAVNRGEIKVETVGPLF
jgi:hypothetical protein